MSDEFKAYACQVVLNAKVLSEELMNRGFNIVSNGTDNHLMLVDLRNRKITGKEATERLDRVGITVNKNSIPNDEQKPSITSGIRIGTPAVTTKGLKEEDMIILAEAIDIMLKPQITDEDVSKATKLVEVLRGRYIVRG